METGLKASALLLGTAMIATVFIPAAAAGGSVNRGSTCESAGDNPFPEGTFLHRVWDNTVGAAQGLISAICILIDDTRTFLCEDVGLCI